MMDVGVSVWNVETMKEKFPMPVVESLDELKCAKYFTKLDLRSGYAYHQVHMHPQDTEKVRLHQTISSISRTCHL
jgi:hypothetical protein